MGTNIKEPFKCKCKEHGATFIAKVKSVSPFGFSEVFYYDTKKGVAVNPCTGDKSKSHHPRNSDNVSVGVPEHMIEKITKKEALGFNF